MQRKRGRNVFCVFINVLLSALLFSGCGAQGKISTDTSVEYTRGVFAMGTYMTLTAYGESAEDALKLSENRIKELKSAGKPQRFFNLPLTWQNGQMGHLSRQYFQLFLHGDLSTENIVYQLRVI